MSEGLSPKGSLVLKFGQCAFDITGQKPDEHVCTVGTSPETLDL